MRKPSRRRPRPHDGGLYPEIDGPAGPSRIRTQHGVEPFEQLGDRGIEPPARRSRAGAAARGRDRRPASSWHTTPRPTRSCGAGGSCAPGEPGDETWGDVPYEDRVHVGSWTAPSVDLDLNLVFVGTSVTSPAPKFLRGVSRTRTCTTTRPSPSTPTPARSSGTRCGSTRAPHTQSFLSCAVSHIPRWTKPLRGIRSLDPPSLTRPARSAATDVPGLRPKPPTLRSDPSLESARGYRYDGTYG